MSKGEESISAISNLEIWKIKNKNNLSNSSVNDKKNLDIQNGLQGNIKELDEENLDQDLIDENISESKDKQIKKMTEHTFEYNPVPSNNPMINRVNLKSNGNIINENELNGKLMNRNINKINQLNKETSNNKININNKNGENGINNSYYPHNMMNIPSMNYMIPNYNNMNEMNGELPNNMIRNVGDNMNYIPVMQAQMMNIGGFIPQIHNNIAQINTINQLNNINMANNAMNMQMMNNNNYMMNQKIPKSNYNFFKNNMNNQAPLNSYIQNNIYNNNLNNMNVNNKKTKNSNINNNKLNEKEKQKIDIIEIISGKDKRTTLMLRNIPNKYKLNDLVKEIDMSFCGKYDYINLPIDYERKLNLGYAFINFVDPLHIILFYEKYHNKRWNLYKSDKKMDMTYADKQGKKDINCKDEQTYYAQYDKRFIFKSLNPKIQIPMIYKDYFRKIYPKSVCIDEKYSIYENPCFQVLNLGKK